jgi:hypothetical protein
VRYEEPVIELRTEKVTVQPIAVVALGKKMEPINYVGCNAYENSGVPQKEFYANRGKALARYLYGNCTGDFIDAMTEELNILTLETKKS